MRTFLLLVLFTIAISAKGGLTLIPVTTPNKLPIGTVRKPVDNKPDEVLNAIATAVISKAPAVNVEGTKTERPEQQVQHVTTGLRGPLDTEKDVPVPKGSSLNTDSLANLMQGVNIFQSRSSGDQENSKDETKHETDTETSQMLKDQENRTGNASLTNATDVNVPEPYERYANRIYLRGHIRDRENDMAFALHKALWRSHHFQYIHTLSVNILETNYIADYDGSSVTEVRYVVSYDGQVLEQVVVRHVLRSPVGSQTLNNELADKDMDQYPYYKTSPPEETTWYDDHSTAIIVISSLLTVTLLVVIILVVYIKTRPKKKSAKSMKGPCVSANRSTDKKKLFADDDNPPPYSKDNPLFQFETNAVMDEQSIP